MRPDIEESREDKKSKSASPGSALLTRADAAALLHCSVSSVRRLEGDVLHPIVGPDGVHRFDPAELARVARDRSASPVDGSREGERDARVFEALDEGKGLREIVTTLRLPVDLVTKLHAAWVKMGSNHDMILSSERLAKLASLLGGSIKHPADLVDRVQFLKEECDGTQAERDKLDEQLSDLVIAIGKTAAHDPDVANVLSRLSNAFSPDLADRLDAALKYFTTERIGLPNDPPSAARENTRPEASARSPTSGDASSSGDVPDASREAGPRSA
jgi:hypothetical protein